MWRYRDWLLLEPDESLVTLGEGATPLLRVVRIGERVSLQDLWVKDEGKNPTGSFKARGLATAVTRAVLAGGERFVVPTAGNAGIALAAYASRAGAAARIYALAGTPPTILSRIRSFGAELVLLDGHIGDCGHAARAYAVASGAVDVSTLREPYRIKGKKTLGLERAEQLGWTLPDMIVYPTGGGTGLIGMWKALDELMAGGWLKGPR
jgi:threonine synthase